MGRREDAHIDANLELLAQRSHGLLMQMTRSNLTCICSGKSAISSRNSVPPSAD